MYELLGQISLFALDFAPAGWEPCEGQLLSISENEDLFSLLGNTFGGNPDEWTFGLPDLRAKNPRECHYCISRFGVRVGSYEGALLGETMISATFGKLEVGNLVECAGQTLPTKGNQALQSLLGTRFGNQGGDKIVLPNLKAEAPAKYHYVIAVQGDYPGGEKREVFVGQILLLPYDLPESALRYFRLCNGDVLKKEEYGALGHLLGKRFGGDGEKTFALPKLTAPQNFNYYLSMGGILPPRS